jgi:hypothetical protein
MDVHGFHYIVDTLQNGTPAEKQRIAIVLANWHAQHRQEFSEQRQQRSEFSHPSILGAPQEDIETETRLFDYKKMDHETVFAHTNADSFYFVSADANEFADAMNCNYQSPIPRDVPFCHQSSWEFTSVTHPASANSNSKIIFAEVNRPDPILKNGKRPKHVPLC